MTFSGDGYSVLFDHEQGQYHAFVSFGNDYRTPLDIPLWRETPEEIFTALRLIPELKADFQYPCWDRITW